MQSRLISYAATHPRHEYRPVPSTLLSPTADATPAHDRPFKQPPRVLWFTGLSGAGKSTLANALEQHLRADAKPTCTLDGDTLRRGLCRDLGFSAADRTENIRRIAEAARLLCDAGLITLVACISPAQADRDAARSIIGAERFVEIYLNTSLATCEHRDVKGLYRQARAGLIKEFTGVSAHYQPPSAADLILDTGILSVEECLAQLLGLVGCSSAAPR